MQARSGRQDRIINKSLSPYLADITLTYTPHADTAAFADLSRLSRILNSKACRFMISRLKGLAEHMLASFCY